MALAASFGGFAVGTLGAVNIGHCIAETIGPMYGIPHGLACGIILPYIVRFNMVACPDRVATLTSYFSEYLPRNTYYRARQLIRELKQLVADLEVPLSLKDVGVPREDLRKIAELTVEHR